MAALNAQTAVQFQQYAAQQYPNNPEQQMSLIRQLQEQHYQQYMQQLYQVQLAQQQVTTTTRETAAGSGLEKYACPLNLFTMQPQVLLYFIGDLWDTPTQRNRRKTWVFISLVKKKKFFKICNSMYFICFHADNFCNNTNLNTQLPRSNMVAASCC